MFEADQVFSHYNLPDKEETYTLRLFLYMAKDLPAGDKTGASDPFVIVRCCGQVAKSKTKYETLNPAFFETLEMQIKLPSAILSGKADFENVPKSVINIMMFDEDTDLLKNKKKQLLGRTLLIIGE